MGIMIETSPLKIVIICLLVSPNVFSSIISISAHFLFHYLFTSNPQGNFHREIFKDVITQSAFHNLNVYTWWLHRSSLSNKHKQINYDRISSMLTPPADCKLFWAETSTWLRPLSSAFWHAPNIKCESVENMQLLKHAQKTHKKDRQNHVCKVHKLTGTKWQRHHCVTTNCISSIKPVSQSHKHKSN